MISVSALSFLGSNTEAEQKRRAAEQTLQNVSDKLSQCEIQLSKVCSDLKVTACVARSGAVGRRIEGFGMRITLLQAV